MAISINTNLAALMGQRRLGDTSDRLGTTLERLSSGLRINRAADDVVGVVSSALQTKDINGIGIGLQNGANAINLLNTAESAIASLENIALQLRDLAVQASDDSINTAQRNNIKTVRSDLLNEYASISTGAEFLGVSLIDGTFTSKEFQIGANFDDQISISIDDARSSTIGKIALFTSTTLTATTLGATTASTLTDTGGFAINGVSFTSADFSSDGVSNGEASESALAYVTAINSKSAETQVSARILSNVVTLGDYTTNAMSTSQTLTLNGVTVATGTNYLATDAGADSLAADINSVSTQTGVTATVDQTNNNIILTATDGRNIDYVFDGGTITNAGVMGLVNTSIDASAIYRGTFQLYSDSAMAITNADAEFASSASVSQGLVSTTSLNNINFNTADNAQTAIFYIDNAITQLAEAKANIGSKTIRMEVQQEDITVRRENLTSSRSSIVDADIAAETANLTALQILQQAGATVLSQANQLPQIALVLLQG